MSAAIIKKTYIFFLLYKEGGEKKIDRHVFTTWKRPFEINKENHQNAALATADDDVQTNRDTNFIYKAPNTRTHEPTPVYSVKFELN